MNEKVLGQLQANLGAPSNSFIYLHFTRCLLARAQLASHSPTPAAPRAHSPLLVTPHPYDFTGLLSTLPHFAPNMEGFYWLLCLCIAMFFGAYLAGLVPLMASIKASRLRYITVFGAGLLVGSALIVIIPEGVAMHYSAQLAAQGGGHHAAAPMGAEHSHAGGQHVDEAYLETVAAEGDVQGKGRRLLSAPDHMSVSAHTAAPAPGTAPRALRAAALKSRGGREAASDALADSAAASTPVGGAAGEEPEAHGHSHGGAPSGGDSAVVLGVGKPEGAAHAHPSGHWQIGAALALGFAFQLVVGEWCRGASMRV